MTKKDLKSGDWVELANGDKSLVIINEELEKSVLVDDSGYMTLRDYNDDLTCRNSVYHKDKFKVVKVWRMKDGFNNKIYKGSFISNDTLIWERKDVREMTVEEVSKQLGYEVKIVKG